MISIQNLAKDPIAAPRYARIECLFASRACLSLYVLLVCGKAFAREACRGLK